MIAGMPTAIVTGANHGIGAATARALAANGASVLLSYLGVNDPVDPGTPAAYREGRAAGAEHVVRRITEAGGCAAAVPADLAAPETPAMLFDEAEQRFGPVDILVNNASGWVQDTFVGADTDPHGRGMQPVSRETFDQQFAVDARAAALLIAELARRHRERGASWGRIVGLTSGSTMGFPSEVSYGAAKAAQENYTMAAALELGDLGITANIVYPPVTDTGWVTDEIRAHVAASAEHFTVAEPEQVAEVIAYLCSDAAGLITGNVIRLR
ncbi:MAG: SDR family oxidoreductase [Pseudonocardiaceae bacterium]|nr:SDR family oxidoreductase [Pseudonocardiaceae bacterium]